MIDFFRALELYKTTAAVEVGKILGLNEKTVRSWRKEFYLNKGEFSEYLRGSYERFVVLNDEEYQKLALDWVRTHSYVKGKPNMTAQHFSEWVTASTCITTSSAGSAADSSTYSFALTSYFRLSTIPTHMKEYT